MTCQQSFCFVDIIVWAYYFEKERINKFLKIWIYDFFFIHDASFVNLLCYSSVFYCQCYSSCSFIVETLIKWLKKIKPSKRLDCLRKARCQASAAACLTLSPSLFIWPVPIIHRVTRSLDFGRNITAFISWPLFCRQLLP